MLLGAFVPTDVPAQSLSTDPPDKRPGDGARPTVVATPPAESVRLDGLLDEGVWDAAPAVDAFTQSEPDEGLPATERTVVRMAFDATTLYVGAYLYDSRPDALVVSDMRKDFRRDNQDTFEVIFDTFADRRNGYVFATNPAGARVRATVGLSLTDTRLEGDGNRFVRALWTVRGSYSFTTNLFVDALVQYDADRNRLSANLRRNLIHHPLSNLYIVYNELRETGGTAQPAGRGLVIKLTQMFPL